MIALLCIVLALNVLAFGYLVVEYFRSEKVRR